MRKYPKIMPYSSEFISRIKQQPPSELGTRLALWAIYHDISAVKLAKATGASRQSVYNWMKGGGILKVYEDHIERLIVCMQTAKTSDDAWKKICLEFNLRT